jgi:hypothetical protein
MQDGQRDAHVLGLYRVADGDWRDPTIEEPVARVTAMLQDLKDRGLIEKHAMWLLKRDPEAGLNVSETSLIGII